MKCYRLRLMCALALPVWACSSYGLGSTPDDAASDVSVGQDGSGDADAGVKKDGGSDALPPKDADATVPKDVGAEVQPPLDAPPVDVAPDVPKDGVVDAPLDVVQDAPVVTISVTPQAVTVPGGKSKSFVANVGGTANQNVTWTVAESGGGTITSGGLYTAPQKSGTFHIIATSLADPTKSALATVSVWYGTFTKLSSSLSVSRGHFGAPPHGISAADGRVLLFGGFGGSAQSAVDTFSGSSFTAGPSMGTARVVPGVIALTDGTALVAGGTSNLLSGTAIASMERWNAVSGAWSSVGSLTLARSRMPMLRLSDNRILVTGGETASATTTNRIDVIDPQAGFSAANGGSLLVARSGHIATLLGDGRVFIAGGSDGANSVTATELYTPVTTGSGPIVAGPSLLSAHKSGNGARLPNGGVIIAGGCASSTSPCAQYVNAVDVYAPVSNQPGTIAATSPLTVASAGHMMVLMPTGRVLLVGGLNASGALARSEVYDPSTGEWTVVGALAEPRSDAMIAILPDGKVLVAGGLLNQGSGIYSASAEVMDPGVPTMCRICQLDGTCVVLNEGTVCDDGNAGTSGETCKSGLCSP